MAQNPQLLTGVRGIIQKQNADGTFAPVAFATDINVNVRAGVRQTYVMGRINPAAIDSLSYDVDVSVGRVVPVNSFDPQATQMAADGTLTPGTDNSAVASGLETAINALVSAGDFNIALQDKVTGKFTTSVKNCRFAGRSMSMNAGDIANERLNFIGIYDSGYEGENASPLIGYEIG